MVTNEEYARLSMEVYDGAAPDGWVPVGDRGDNPISGFYAQAYRKGDEVVIAFRGTQFWSPVDLDDLAADAAIFADGHHRQFLDALEYAQAITNDPNLDGTTITVTGHSLGGGLAQLAADVFALGGVTFDAPGVFDLSQNSAGENQVLHDWVAGIGESFGHVGALTNYTVPGSLISSGSGAHIGEVLLPVGMKRLESGAMIDAR